MIEILTRQDVEIPAENDGKMPIRVELLNDVDEIANLQHSDVISSVEKIVELCVDCNPRKEISEDAGDYIEKEKGQTSLLTDAEG